MLLPELSESDVRALASPQSFARGQEYYACGAIAQAERCGDTLTVLVRGSERAPYRVTVALDENGIRDVHCTCPYDWGGICKHSVAALLAWVRQPEGFRAVAPLDERLAERSREELVALIKEMVVRQPDLARLLDLPLRPGDLAPLDLDAVRKQVDYALSREDARRAGRELKRLAEMGRRYLDSDDPATAGTFYHLILQEALSRFEDWWLEWDGDGNVLGVLSDCAEHLGNCLEQVTEAATREDWLQVLLEAALEDIRLGGVDFAWPAKDVVLRHATGEEWAWVEARLRQEMQRADGWKREALVRFITARLDAAGQESDADAFVLEHGTPEQQAFLLLGLGRVEQAVEIARRSFANLPGLAIDFANALVDAGHGEIAASYMSEQARQGHSSYHPWLARYYEEHGDRPSALEYWRREFEGYPSLETYQELRRLARELGTWDSVRPALLAMLHPMRQAWLQLAIALDEGDVPWGLEIAARAGPLVGAEALLRLAQAAEADHPRAAIEIYRSGAERGIATRCRAGYKAAASFLLRVRELHRQLGEEAAWRAYISRLRDEHRRLRALREELDRAGL